MPINVVETKDVRYIQNTTGGQLTLNDLGPKGCYLDVDETVDLHKYFTKEDIQKSQSLARAIRSGMVQQLEDLVDPKIKKTGKKYENYPMTPETPVTDTPNHFDQAYKDLVKKDKQEELETRASER